MAEFTVKDFTTYRVAIFYFLLKGRVPPNIYLRNLQNIQHD